MSENPILPLDRERLDILPGHLAEAIRDAVAGEEEEELLALVDGVAEHDSEVAMYLRELIEALAFETLKDLFDVRGR